MRASEQVANRQVWGAAQWLLGQLLEMDRGVHSQLAVANARIAELERRVESLTAQNGLLREIAVRPPTIVDNTETILRGMREILNPAPVVNNLTSDPKSASSDEFRDLVFVPSHELDDVFPKHAGWVNGDDADKLSHLFRAGDGQTQPPHEGGLIE